MPGAPWEREPAESRPAYDAFLRYRGLDPAERSIDAAHRRWAASRPGQRQPGGTRGAETAPTSLRRRAPSRWFAWASAHAWVSRAAAWDAEIDRRADERDAEERARRRVEARRLLDAAADLAIGSATRSLADLLESGRWAALTPPQAVALLRVGFDLKERALALAERELAEREARWARHVREVAPATNRDVTASVPLGHAEQELAARLREAGLLG